MQTNALTRSLVPAALALLLLVGCASPGAADPGHDPDAPTVGEGVNIRGEWMLVSVIQGDIDRSFSDVSVTMEFANGSARVRTGCFSFDQPMMSDLEVVTIGYSQPIASCIGFSDEQTQAIESLADVVEAKRDGNILRLMSDKSVLRFELLPAVPQETLLGTFGLTHIAWGDVATAFDGSPTITFEADGTVSGSTGCNEFRGTLDEPVSGTNTIEDLAMTKVACDDPADADITAILEGGFLIHELDGAILLIASTSETALIYDPVP